MVEAAVVEHASSVVKKVTCHEIVPTPAPVVVAAAAAAEHVSSVGRRVTCLEIVRRAAAVAVASSAERTATFLATVPIPDQATEAAEEVTSSCNVTVAVYKLHAYVQFNVTCMHTSCSSWLHLQYCLKNSCCHTIFSTAGLPIVIHR